MHIDEANTQVIEAFTKARRVVGEKSDIKEDVEALVKAKVDHFEGDVDRACKEMCRVLARIERRREQRDPQDREARYERLVKESRLKFVKR